MLLTSATYEPVDCNDPTLQEILVALSFALDLTEGAVPGHAIRSALLAVRVAMAAGLDTAGISGRLLRLSTERRWLQQQLGAHVPDRQWRRQISQSRG